ncbi:MFS transporter, MCP family, solute carrier family 16, member 10 [Elsinoe ampelina]|uniref:MFS transporter, MCP family, solute carrier family 16, member 10 n=1 Tax=Elsinoe ampelina TaxID=302913 RepID=A0A6A6GKC1_9PEZI|nr:MFS transporter, MCP family, solute carrier family 16, member 10 [Elsinoe ampelina]
MDPQQNLEKGAPHDEEKAMSTASEEPKPTPPHMSVPDEGTRAWLVVLGAMIINGCSFGYASSFGVYQSFLSLGSPAYGHPALLGDRTTSEISWLGSIQLFFMFSGGLIAGALFDRFGARVIMIPASFVYVLAIMFTSLCTEYWQFILAQILGGFANGFLFSPAISVIGHYFAKKRGAALGLVAIGSSIGGVLIPISLESAFNSHVGFGWGVRGVGFVFASLLAIACALIKERLPPRKGRLFAPEALKQLSYVLVVMGVFFLIWGVFVVFFFLSDYAIVKIGTTTDLAFYLLSVLNGASLFGRLVFGILADKAGTLTLLTLVAAVNSVMIFCWPSTSTEGGLIGWTIIFGFTSGGIFSLFPAGLAAVVPNPQFIGTYMGQAMAAFGIAGLTGSPIAGAIVSKYGFFPGAAFGGSALMAGAICIAAARFVQQPNLSIKA